jgi:hypothetical protein
MTQTQQVVDYLWAISPDGATNAQLANALGIASQQTVYMLTQELARWGRIRSERQGRTWVFYAANSALVGTASALARARWGSSGSGERAAAQFVAVARHVLSVRYGADLAPRTVPGIRKRFALVSPDFQVVGDAKYVAGSTDAGLAPAKFAMISEDVWLLEKCQAERVFMVFGGDRQTPALWLKRFGELATGVAYYYQADDGALERLDSNTWVQVDGVSSGPSI